MRMREFLPIYENSQGSPPLLKFKQTNKQTTNPRLRTYSNRMTGWKCSGMWPYWLLCVYVLNSKSIATQHRALIHHVSLGRVTPLPRRAAWAFDPRSHEAEAGGSLWVPGQQGLHCLNKQTPKEKWESGLAGSSTLPSKLHSCAI